MRKIRASTVMFMILGVFLSIITPSVLKFSVGELMGACIVWSIIFEW